MTNYDLTLLKNLRALFENMTNAFALHEIICDENNIPCNYLFLQVNPAFEKLTGLKAEDIVGKTVLDALPGTEKYWIDTYGKVALTGEPILMENYHSGLNKYYEVLSFSPKHKQFAVIFSDITKRKLIEIEKEQLINDLTISQNKYKVLFDNMTNAFSLHEIIYDENNIPYNFRFLEVNPAYERITNSKATDVLQKTALDFSTPKEMIELCIKVALTGIPEQFENYSVEFNKYYELLVFSPKHNQFAVIFSDVTERKQSELEREKLIRELELKNEELERFTYTVSHDLKSPLITIKGFLGLIQRDFQEGNTENIEDDINRINNAADKMQQLLEDLLELSRIGRILNPFSSFSMSDVIKDVEEQLQTSLNEKNITFVYDKNMPSISADKNRINELWQNLIENSIKYMDNKEKPEIKIGCIDDVYYIKDNGLGIESCYFEKIFGLFEKLNQKSKGTGIGLALVKRIIEFHGGKIWVESGGIGKGTAFYFTLR